MCSSVNIGWSPSVRLNESGTFLSEVGTQLHPLVLPQPSQT
jgi:hypothetical protein